MRSSRACIWFSSYQRLSALRFCLDMQDFFEFTRSHRRPKVFRSYVLPSVSFIFYLHTCRVQQRVLRESFYVGCHKIKINNRINLEIFVVISRFGRVGGECVRLCALRSLNERETPSDGFISLSLPLTLNRTRNPWFRLFQRRTADVATTCRTANATLSFLINFLCIFNARREEAQPRRWDGAAKGRARENKTLW